jgi:DNA-binding NarL/FixJ family response regulator
MKEDRDPIDVTQTPAQRRSWLLSEALRSLPLDRALELARTAEAFIMGADKEALSDPTAEIPNGQPNLLLVGDAVVEKQVREARPSLSLSPEQREQLLNRLAQGARNRDLASEFGLSARQVQGVRMGAARQIADRRNRQGSTGPES